MSKMGLWLLMSSLGQGVYRRALFKRLISGVAAALALMVMTALLGTALLIGGLFAGYHLMVRYGIDPSMALTAMGAIGAILVIVLISSTIAAIEQLRDLTRVFNKGSGISARATDIVESFMDGLMGRP